MRVVVFISGRGSNLQALLEDQNHYKVTHVISNRSQAAGLTTAERFSVPATVIDWRDKIQAEAQAITLLNNVNPDLIVLAGFMRVLSAEFVAQFPRKIINIHPSLLPLYPGLNTHQRALEDRQTIHGATVHFVDQHLDRGHSISQCHINIKADDSAETLADRLLSKEHALLTTTIKKIAQGEIYWRNKQLYYNNQIISQPILWSNT